METITELKKEILAQELLIRETYFDLQNNRKKLAELEKKVPKVCTQRFWDNINQKYNQKQK